MFTKRIFALLLTAVLLLTGVPFSVSAVQENEVIDFVTKYNGCSFHGYYTDSYFAGAASAYNPSLATASLCTAIAGFGSFGGAETALGALGFSDMDANSYSKNDITTADSMGVVAARKTISVADGCYTLLAVVPRSGDYADEWASNFTLGKAGNAQGFSEAAGQVLDYLKEYVGTYGSDFESEHIKVWIVGYSRGAAVANLTAAALTDDVREDSTVTGWDGVSLTREDIYAYTFETPMGASTDTVTAEDAKLQYRNIHNIINDNDLVVGVAPAAMGFLRYGVDEAVIPAGKTSENEALYNRAAAILKAAGGNATGILLSADGDGLFSDDFQGKAVTRDIAALSKLGSWVNNGSYYEWVPVDTEEAMEALLEDTDMTMAEFLENLWNGLSEGVGTREDYVNHLEPALRILMCELEGRTSQTEKWDCAKALLKNKLQTEAAALLVTAVTGGEQALAALLTDWVTGCMEEAGLDVEDYEQLSEVLINAIPTAASAAYALISYDGGDTLASLIANLDKLVLGHYPELCMAWMEAWDPNYDDAAYSAPAYVSEFEKAAVTDVNVTVKENVTVKRFLFFKRKSVSYTYSFAPESGAPVFCVAYRLNGGDWVLGTSFTVNNKQDSFDIAVADACKVVTGWTYNAGTGTVTQWP